jgi:hypothetical protein
MEFLFVVAVVLGVLYFVGWLLKSSSAKDAGEKMTSTASSGCGCIGWIVILVVGLFVLVFIILPALFAR